MAGDFVLLWVALFLSYLVWAWRGGNPFSLTFALERKVWMALPLLWFALAVLGGFYDYRNFASFRQTLRGAVACAVAIFLGYVGFFFFFSPRVSLPRGIVLYYTFSSALLIGAWRYLLLSIHGNPLFRRRCAVLGKEAEARDVVAFLAHYPFYQVVGPDEDFDELILTPSILTDPSLAKDLLPLAEKGVPITPFPLLYEQLTGRVPVESLQQGWWYTLCPGGAEGGGFYPLIKRTLDVLGALVGLAVLGALLPWVALAIKLTSPGPIFYRQQRVGKGGRIFTIWKIRTMKTDAEKSGAVWAADRDPRVTPIGRLLRKTRFDEFPQCWNILKGDMSIIGPRPERPEFVEQLRRQIPFFELRHSVNPGMAGWAMVNHGYVATVEDAKIRLEYDLYYIKHQSLWFDFLIFMRALLQLCLLKGR